jgi:hypothetical protein
MAKIAHVITIWNGTTATDVGVLKQQTAFEVILKYLLERR